MIFQTSWTPKWMTNPTRPTPIPDTLPNFQARYDHTRVLVDDALKAVLDGYLHRLIATTDTTQEPARVMMGHAVDTLVYGVMGSGKRLRPVMTLWTAAALGGLNAHPIALPAACAVELVHAFSLIHDDLPCMDNDDLRRGRPTLHKAFSEWEALLAGDTLQALAFDVLLTAPQLPAPLALWTSQRLCHAMVGPGLMEGQMLDMASEGTNITALDMSPLRHLTLIHQMKTGAMITFAAEAGAMAGLMSRPGHTSSPPAQLMAEEPAYPLISQWAQHLGQAFQVWDDVLDATAARDDLGKTPGKDQERGKLTYVTLLGEADARAWAETLYQEALSSLSRLAALGIATEALEALSAFVVRRSR
jgi:farnesyl diphosphate synthase